MQTREASDLGARGLLACASGAVGPGITRLHHGARRGFVGRRAGRRQGHRRQRRHQLDPDRADERQRNLHHPLSRCPAPTPLTVEQSGFRTTRQNVIVRVADRIVVDFTLEPRRQQSRRSSWWRRRRCWRRAPRPRARSWTARSSTRSRSATAPPTASRAWCRARPSSAPTRCSARWTTTTCAASP